MGMEKVCINKKWLSSAFSVAVSAWYLVWWSSPLKNKEDSLLNMLR